MAAAQRGAARVRFKNEIFLCAPQIVFGLDVQLQIMILKMMMKVHELVEVPSVGQRFFKYILYRLYFFKSDNIPNTPHNIPKIIP